MAARDMKDRLADVPAGGLFVDELGVERTIQRAFADPASIGDNAIVAAQGAGVKIRVLGYTLASAGATNARFRSATNSISSLKTLAANTQVSAPFTEHGWFQTNPNEALNLNLSAAIAVGVDVIWCTAT